MRTTLLLSSAALLAMPSHAQAPRDPNHPLPPTASSLVTTTPQLPAQREPATAPALPAPAGNAPASSRRSAPKPAGTMVPVPSTVQFDRPSTGTLWAGGADWKASFDGTGFQFIPFFGSEAPRNFPLRVELDSATVGGQAIELAAGVPDQQGFVVRTARGGLTEVVDATLRSIEQSWVFDTLPNRGEIRVEVRLQGAFTAQTTADGVRFTNEFGTVAYEKAVATDARGAQVSVPIEWTGTEAHIAVPASFVESAQLPLVVDPWLSTISNITAGPPVTQFQYDADVATLQTPDRRCVVWRRQYSATDHDVWAQVFDGANSPIGTAFFVDFTVDDWLSPAVAGNQFSHGFLVVSDVRIGTAYHIAGRRVADTNAVNGPQFDIERSGVVGLPGNNFRPDVGGDFYPGLPAYYAVVFEKEVAPGNRDIYLKLVQQNGTLLTTNPIVIDNSSTDESNACISKQDGSIAQWFVAYQSTWPAPPFDQDLHGRFVNWNGILMSATPYIAGSYANETAPCTSSPVLVDGSWYWLVCHETDLSTTSGPRDILCKVYDATGSQITSLNLNVAEQGGIYQSYDQQAPDCDGDGIRFVVGYTDRWQGAYDYETHVSTLAFVTNPNALRIDDDRRGLGVSADDEFGTHICSDQSGGLGQSSRYAVVGTDLTTNDVVMWDYGGWQTGIQFGYYASSCGGPVSITPTGNTAAGYTVTITIANGPLSGTLFGFPGYIPLNGLGCNCVCGVSSALVFGNPLVWTVPPNPAYTGMTLSVQGWTALGTNCLGFIDLSDTVDFVLR